MKQPSEWSVYKVMVRYGNNGVLEPEIQNSIQNELDKLVRYLAVGENIGLLETLCNSLYLTDNIQVFLDFTAKVSLMFGEHSNTILAYFSNPFTANESGTYKHIYKRLNKLHLRYSSVVSTFNGMMTRPQALKAMAIAKASNSPEINVHISRNDLSNINVSVLPNELPQFISQLIDALVNTSDKKELVPSSKEKLIDCAESLISFVRGLG